MQLFSGIIYIYMYAYVYNAVTITIWAASKSIVLGTLF